jgi:hypothetical protein
MTKDKAAWKRAQKLALKLAEVAGQQDHADMFATLAFLTAGQLAVRAPTRDRAEKKLAEMHEFTRSLLDSMWKFQQ